MIDDSSLNELTNLALSILHHSSLKKVIQFDHIFFCLAKSVELFLFFFLENWRALVSLLRRRDSRLAVFCFCGKAAFGWDVEGRIIGGGWRHLYSNWVHSNCVSISFLVAWLNFHWQCRAYDRLENTLSRMTRFDGSGGDECQ